MSVLWNVDISVDHQQDFEALVFEATALNSLYVRCFYIQLKFANASGNALQLNVEKKWEQKSKTEMIGDRNTRKAKTMGEDNAEYLVIKMCFKFLFKTGGVCDHLKFTWKPVPLCCTTEWKGTFAKFCMQFTFSDVSVQSIPSLFTRIVPLRFQAGGRRRRPNLGLVCFFCV